MRRKGLQKTVHQYTAVFEPDEDRGGYTVTIPSLPGCISEGDTFEEALRNIQEAASLYLEELGKHNEEIPTEDKGVIVSPVHVEMTV